MGANYNTDVIVFLILEKTFGTCKIAFAIVVCTCVFNKKYFYTILCSFVLSTQHNKGIHVCTRHITLFPIYQLSLF